METKTFEQCYGEIEAIVENKRRDWTFKASIAEDFDDIKQKILLHIFVQWSKYDQSRPLGGWVAEVTRNQFKNTLRDLYLSTSAPCSGCTFNLGDGFCREYGEQCNACPLYAKWSKKKKFKHEAKLPLPLENHFNEPAPVFLDIERQVNNLHEFILDKLTESEKQIYQRLYIQGLSEDEVAIELDLKTNEEGRKNGNKRIRQVKLIALNKAREIIKIYGYEIPERIRSSV